MPGEAHNAGFLHQLPQSFWGPWAASIPPAVTKRKAKDLFVKAAKKARLGQMASASKKKPGKQWNDSFQNCERHVHCIIESDMNYNMHILYTLNMLKYILSRYKISLLGYSHLR